MIYKFLMKMIIPAANYGAFIDEAEAQDDYNNIDGLTAEFLQELFQSNLSIQETIHNMSEPVENGG